MKSDYITFGAKKAVEALIYHTIDLRDASCFDHSRAIEALQYLKARKFKCKIVRSVWRNATDRERLQFIKDATGFSLWFAQENDGYKAVVMFDKNYQNIYMGA